jgi:hypothetical protein
MRRTTFRLLATLVPLTVSAPAQAEDARFECEVADTNGESQDTFEITVNEEAGTVSLLSRSLGSSATLPASITTSRISFARREGRTTISYIIDRITLGLLESVRSRRREASGRSGQCTLVP